MKTVSVDLDIGEISNLMTYHWEIYDMINKLPKERQEAMTMAKWPLKETGRKHLARYRELEDIKDTTWPK